MGWAMSKPHATTGMTFAQTLDAMRQDVRRYSDAAFLVVLIKVLYAHPSFAGVLYYRIGHWLWSTRRNPLAWLAYVCHRALYPLVRMYSGLELLPYTSVGPGLQVLHFGPTIVHPTAVVGKNVSLLHGVTIGVSLIGISNIGAPRIGDNVAIGTGAAVIGDISIGDNVTIGAGAVVTCSVPNNNTVVGIPARSVLKGQDRLPQSTLIVAEPLQVGQFDMIEVSSLESLGQGEVSAAARDHSSIRTANGGVA